MYQEDYLRNYIKESELREFNDRIKVRLSSHKIRFGSLY